MRVISGKFKGKKLFSPSHEGVRPTSDKVKESMFNILASSCGFDGARVLDLFCGSGALGIEALSRGASHAVFVDLDPLSISLVKKNLAHTGAEPSEVFNADYRLALKRLAAGGFDIIFLDPPYLGNLLTDALNLISRYGVLAEDGVIICEHSLAKSFADIMPKCEIDTRRLGKTYITTIHKK